MVPSALEEDHNQLADLLSDLKSRLNGGNAPEAFAALDIFWARLAIHIRAEHLCLFPAILNAASEKFNLRDVPSFEETSAAIETLRADHNSFMDELSRAVKSFRELLADERRLDKGARLDEIKRRVETVALRLESHNVLEEEQIYNLPDLILSTSEREQLSVAIERELNNLPERFANYRSPVAEELSKVDRQKNPQR